AQYPDTWQWQPDPATGYSVCDAYRLLTSYEFVSLDAIEDLIWHKRVPLKVSIFAWRLLVVNSVLDWLVVGGLSESI
ncbi:helicase-like protein, partial [Trifolium medium]|nr:helicase-like protein [Trifolium medium]